MRQELETLHDTDDEEISLPSSTFYKSIRPIDLGSVTIRNVGLHGANLTDFFAFFDSTRDFNSIDSVLLAFQ